MSIKHWMYKQLMGMSHHVPVLAGRVGHTIYPYMCQPRQLMAMADLAEHASEQARGRGVFVEAGCAYGATTVFLGKLMQQWSYQYPYYALDTFSGFTGRDVAIEVAQRGKPRDLATDFVVNDRRWFDRDMRDHGVPVRSIQCDVATFDYASLGGIAFCLLDVDLYAPIKAALPRIVNHLVPGGIIVVDDCVQGGRYDGAEAAYREYVEERGLPYDVQAHRLGIIEQAA